ncbi:MAG: hypothetical protein HDS53_04885 [Barnesiella sp.]|nr:hypothetical protein [Barnesiella sp.]
MNKLIFILALSCLIAIDGSAQFSVYSGPAQTFIESAIKDIYKDQAEEILRTTKTYNCNDPEFDWQQYNDKTGKALVSKNFLELESKKDDLYCMSFCELPIDMRSDDFSVKLMMTPVKFSDNNPIGIVYDVESESNYRMLLLMKKSFQLVNVSDGKMSIVKKGLYKMPDKSKLILLDITRQKGKLIFSINGLEMIRTSSPEMKNPNFGFAVGPKAKLLGFGIGYEKVSPDLDEEGQL